jgi:hypothetical protein
MQSIGLYQVAYYLKIIQHFMAAVHYSWMIFFSVNLVIIKQGSLNTCPQTPLERKTQYGYMCLLMGIKDELYGLYE